MEEVPDEPVEVPIAFKAHERQLSVPEEVVLFLNELNAANMLINAKIEAHSQNPIMKFIDGKFAIVDHPLEKFDESNENFKDGTSENIESQKAATSSELQKKDAILFTTNDWYLIGEFRIVTKDESDTPTDIEFVWGWAIRPEDPHTQPITAVTEELPHGLQPLTFPLVKFEDIGLIEIIKAYAFHTMNLEYVVTKWSEQLQSWGIFGLKNIAWGELQKPRSPEWEKILTKVREIVSRKKAANPELDHKAAVEATWKESEILEMVAEYRKVKDAAYQQRLELTNKIRQAMVNPAAMIAQMMNADTVGGEPDNTQSELNTSLDNSNIAANNESLNYAMQAVQRAFNRVEEAELANMDAVGNDIDV